MQKQIDKLGKTLQAKASEYIGQPFSLTDYIISGEDRRIYKAIGTIKRYGTCTKVEVDFDKETLEPRYWAISNKRITMPTERIGCIELSDKACATDPCYERDIWCMAKLQDLRPGDWDVFASIDTIDVWGKRTYILELFHQGLTEKQKANLKWVHEAELGVDSGQMSVFDDAFYRLKDGSAESFKADEEMGARFYKECCDLSEEYAGIYYSNGKAVGVVCSSGCGDGVYPLYISKVDGQIISMKISFM